MGNRLFLGLVAGAALGVATGVPAQPEHDGDMHHHASSANVQDDRTMVTFPDAMRHHTLRNMRDHLRSLQHIQEALAAGHYEVAAEIAEQRLGMASLKLHGAHEVAPYMPAGMQAIGTEMHHSASRFAVVAKDASATGEVKPALAALAHVTEQCVACHAAYRLQ